MSKMGQYVIELTEKRIAEYYGYSNRNGCTTAEKQNQPLPNLPLDDLLMGPEFFWRHEERTQTEAKMGRGSAAEGHPLPTETPESKKFSVCKAVKDRVEGMRVHCIKVPEMPINEDNEQAQPTGAYLQGADGGQLQPWEQ